MNSFNFAIIGSKERLVDRVVLEIQEQILTGHLSPGTKLPPERDLAIQLNVSRTVLREATHILVAKGLLETKHGAGTKVRELTVDRVAESLILILRSRGISLDNIHQIRSILEVEIAGLAALNTSQDDIDELNHALLKMETSSDDPEAFSKADAEFHQVLAKTTRNPLFTVLLDSIRSLMQEVRAVVQDYPGLSQIVIPDHQLIISKIIEKDAVGARQAMLIHLEHARAIQEEAIAKKEVSQ